MAEYIEKEKVLDALDELLVIDPIWEAVKRVPAADVAPVRHGRWKLTNTMDTAEDALYCSQCKYIAWVGRGTSEHRTPYCPQCGAKLDGEDD